MNEINPFITSLKNGEINLCNSVELKKAITGINTEFTLIYTHSEPVRWEPYALERMLRILRDTQAGMVYADRYKTTGGKTRAYPVNDYQEGSLRDDFDFGATLLYNTSVLKQAVSSIDNSYKYAALYALRLKASIFSRFVHINEYLYTEQENDRRLSGEKMFDYVNPQNREVQIEMEMACTQHLKETGAYLYPEFKTVDLSGGNFSVEASVIIPVKNREKTIEDAVRSALNQQTGFPYNVIVVDNHSTDNTTAILKKLSEEDSRLIAVIPQHCGLNIGGCWNEAIMHPQCGKFAVQLDSDDLYIDDRVLSRIVSAFYEQKTPMIIGSYQTVDFDLKAIPPGLVDHREWTPENGRNNALRINGLGAPRAFFTPLLREIKFPNTSYGEDYAVALAISRRYQIDRIYESLYLCRRWNDNTDSALDILKTNEHNHYKDRLRTLEWMARKL
jgi:hypothetical protein